MFQTVSDGADSMWLSSSDVYGRENIINASVTEKHQLYTPTSGGLDSVMNRDDYNLAINVIECGSRPVVGLLGLPANIINMVVFYRQGLRDKMNLCLFTLAFFDFMFVFFMILYTMYCPAAFFLDAVLVQNYKWNTLKFTLNFRNAFMFSSGTLTAIIATERCICVVWPLKSDAIFKTKTMAWLICGMIVIFNLLCLPYALKHVVRWKTDETGSIRIVLDDTDLYINNKLTFQIIRDTILPAISFFTFFIVSFVTVVTVRKLKTAMDWREKASNNVMDKRQMTLVKMLITVSCVYIACSIPKLSLAIVKFLVADFSTLGRYKDWFFLTHGVAFTLLMVNSSVNIFIYYRQSSRFRKELHACVCCFKDGIDKNQQIPELKENA